MSPQELIDAALLARDNFASAQSGVTTAGQTLQAAQAAMQSADKALHDYLVDNRPLIRVDEVATPPTAIIFTAAEPDTFTMTPADVA